MTYVSPRKPWEHQEKALAHVTGTTAFGLLMEMRTGKTKVVLDEYGRLEQIGRCKNLIILAPGGAYKTWVQEDTPETAGALGNLSHDLRSRLRIHLWESGSTKTKQFERSQFMRYSGPKMLVVNIEALSRVEAARAMCVAICADGNTMVVVDESTSIKNHSAKRTKFIVETLGPMARFRRILTGLITPRDPLDIYSQFEFLDWRILGYRSFYTFRERYAHLKEIEVDAEYDEQTGEKVKDGRKVTLVVGFKNQAELQAKIDPYTYRVRLRDCGDVPDEEYLMREVEWHPEQLRLYKEMRRDAVARLEEEVKVTATIVIVQMLRLHQILMGHLVDDHGNVVSVPTRRPDALLEALEEHDGKAIIWCSYDADVRRIQKALEGAYGEGSCARFWGGNRDTREDEERWFVSQDDCRFMIATPAAAKFARTWPQADLAVYYSNRDNLEDRAQSEMRNKLVGKTGKITYLDLVVPGTVDMKILKSLREKINMSGAIMKDGWRKWLI